MGAYRCLPSQWIDLYNFLYIIYGNSDVMNSIVTPLLREKNHCHAPVYSIPVGDRLGMVRLVR